MENKLPRTTQQASLTTIASLSTLIFQLSTFAQGTAFTYQGRLNANGTPANGVYDLQFVLYPVASGGSSILSLQRPAASITNGLFTVTLDYGANFPGAARWLEIAVTTNGGPVFTILSPRQQLTPTPYAITAGSVVSGGLPAAYTNIVNFNNANNSFNGSFTGNGSGLTGVWKIGGNAGTSSDFLGTTDDQPLDIRVNNVRVMRYRLATDASGTYTNAPNVIGGSSVNSSLTTVVGATIAGGGGNGMNGSSFANRVTANYGTVGGGSDNASRGISATISGGSGHAASGDFATVSGGYANTSSGYAATVGGGWNSTASGDYAVVPGGQYNVAAGAFSFAGGYAAQANHEGSFVWTGNNFFPFTSTIANGFFVRCTGGARFVTAIDGSGNQTAGVRILSGDTAWSSISDRNAKKNFSPVNAESVLEKLAALPVQSWNYKWESDTNTPHLGPMAQDFKAAFYPGRDDKSISTLEFDGVELAAIQGLNEKLEHALKDKDLEIQQLKRSVADLQTLVSQMRQPKAK